MIKAGAEFYAVQHGIILVMPDIKPARYRYRRRGREL